MKLEFDNMGRASTRRIRRIRLDKIEYETSLNQIDKKYDLDRVG